MASPAPAGDAAKPAAAPTDDAAKPSPAQEASAPSPEAAKPPPSSDAAKPAPPPSNPPPPPSIPPPSPSNPPPPSDAAKPAETAEAAKPAPPPADGGAVATAGAQGPTKAGGPEDTKGKKKAEDKPQEPEAPTSSTNLGLPTLLITGDTLSTGLKRQKDPIYADLYDSPWTSIKKQPPMITTGTRLLRSARNPEAAQREVERLKKQKEEYMKMQGKLGQVGSKMKDLNHEFLPMDPLVFGDSNEPLQNPSLAGDANKTSDAQKAIDQKYRMQEPLKCAILFTDCTANFTIPNPPEDPHEVLQHYEIAKFLSTHGLPPFKKDTYRYTFLPGSSEIGFGSPDDHWERHADCVIVIRPQDYNALKSKANALRRLNDNLLNMEMEQIKHLEASRRFMEAFFYAKSKGHKDDSRLLADLLVQLETELREATEKLALKEKEVMEKASVIQILDGQLKAKIHALEASNKSLLQSQDRNSWIEHKYDVVSASMFKIWVRTLLERVRKRMAEDLQPYNNLIRFSRDHHANMSNWHLTLNDIRNQPGACWLLADRGLDETLVELTRMSTGKDKTYTLHQIANIAAHSARDEEIAEAITSKTMEEYGAALEKLFRYVRGSDLRLEELKNDL